MNRSSSFVILDESEDISLSGSEDLVESLLIDASSKESLKTTDASPTSTLTLKSHCDVESSSWAVLEESETAPETSQTPGNTFLGSYLVRYFLVALIRVVDDRDFLTGVGDWCGKDLATRFTDGNSKRTAVAVLVIGVLISMPYMYKFSNSNDLRSGLAAANDKLHSSDSALTNCLRTLNWRQEKIEQYKTNLEQLQEKLKKTTASNEKMQKTIIELQDKVIKYQSAVFELKETKRTILADLLARAMERRLRQFANVHGGEETRKLLDELKNGSGFHESDENGNTLTHFAALYNNIELLQALKGNDLLELEVSNKIGQTPLFFAVLSGSIETVRFFLESGASFDVTDVLGETALHIACKNSNPSTCIALVAAGVDPNAINLEGETALHLATKESLFEAVQVLLMRKANPNIQNQVGNLPLHIACINGDHNSVQFLCEHGSQVNAYNQEAMTPLHYAAKTGDIDISRCLLCYGADPTLPNNLGITADIMAFAQGHNSVGKLLAQMTTAA
nr:unnamed protein product [Spirometra erinaceieuropaei]